LITGSEALRKAKGYVVLLAHHADHSVVHLDDAARACRDGSWWCQTSSCRWWWWGCRQALSGSWADPAECWHPVDTAGWAWASVPSSAAGCWSILT